MSTGNLPRARALDLLGDLRHCDTRLLLFERG
jgi:hypothetical protein